MVASVWPAMPLTALLGLLPWERTGLGQAVWLQPVMLCLDLGDPNTYQVSTPTRSSDELSSSQFSAASLETEAQRREETCSGDTASGEWGSWPQITYPGRQEHQHYDHVSLPLPLLYSIPFCKLTAPTCTPLGWGAHHLLGSSLPSLDSSFEQAFLSLNQIQPFCLFSSSPVPGPETQSTVSLPDLGQPYKYLEKETLPRLFLFRLKISASPNI